MSFFAHSVYHNCLYNESLNYF